MGPGYRPTQAEVVEIRDMCKEEGIPGVMPYRLDSLLEHLEARKELGTPITRNEQKLWRIGTICNEAQSNYRSQQVTQLMGTCNAEGVQMCDAVRACKTQCLLREAQATYGGRVFNFAITPSEGGSYPPPVTIKRDFCESIWQGVVQLGTQVPERGKMMRVDAIRTADGIRIIEMNPCWVDNIGALDVFHYVYGIDFPEEKRPSEFIADLLPSTGHIVLVYCSRSQGASKDEMYAMSNLLLCYGNVPSIVTGLRYLSVESDGISVYDHRGELKMSGLLYLYLNGSFTMLDTLTDTERKVLCSLIKVAEEGLIHVIPYQMGWLEDKGLLVQLSQWFPDLFAETTLTPPLSGGYFTKARFGESLSGVRYCTANEDPILKADGCVYQVPMFYKFAPPLVTVDTTRRVIKYTSDMYEKLNIWILDNHILGVMATYSKTPIINDSGYNLPISVVWK